MLRQVHGQEGSVTWMVVLLIGLMFATLQLYWGTRVGLDAELLGALAQRSPETAAQDLDASLAALGLRAAPERERDWAERWRGARRMLLRQGLCVVAQMVSLAAAGWVS